MMERGENSQVGSEGGSLVAGVEGCSSEVGEWAPGKGTVLQQKIAGHGWHRSRLGQMGAVQV